MKEQIILKGVTGTVTLEATPVYSDQKYYHGYQESMVGERKAKLWFGHGKLVINEKETFFQFKTAEWTQHGSCFEKFHEKSCAGVYDCPLSHFIYAALKPEKERNKEQTDLTKEDIENLILYIQKEVSEQVCLMPLLSIKQKSFY